jgi:hypothetical protein
LKRLAAPLCVFSLGINSSQLSVFSSQLNRQHSAAKLFRHENHTPQLLLIADS